MEFTLQCPCGEKLPVVATDAASNKICSCGQSFQIPRLSLLRRYESEGRTELPSATTDEAAAKLPPPPPPTPASVLTVAQRLQLLASDGSLPDETRCLQCERNTQDVLNCYIECEMPQSPSQAGGWLHAMLLALLVIFSPLRALRHASAMNQQEVEVVGNEVVVRAPLRICADCATRLRRDKRRVREMLQQMQLYQPLFRQYPDAVINIPKL